MMGTMLRFQTIGINVEIERLQKDILPLRQKIDTIGKNPNQQARAVAARRLLGVVERDLETCGKSISILIDVDEGGMIAQKDDILQIGEKVIKVEEALMELVDFCVAAEGTTKGDTQPETKIETIQKRELTESPKLKMTKNNIVGDVPSSKAQTAKNTENTLTSLNDESMVAKSAKSSKKVVNDNMGSNITSTTTQSVEDIIKPKGETKAVSSNPIEDVSDEQNEEKESQMVAVQQELKAIEKLPRGVNVRNPGNPYWCSLIKVATIANHGYIEKDDALVAIKKASNHLGFSEMYIEDQWQRVCRRAKLI